MLRSQNRILFETIKRLLRKGAAGNLRKIVNKTHAADLSIFFGFISYSDQKRIFDIIEDKEKKGLLLSELEKDTFLRLISDIPDNLIISILETMPNDDVADLIGKLPPERASSILEGMNKIDSEEVEVLLRYDDKTAGGIMNPHFVALKEDITAGEAIASLQKEYRDVEMPFYLYVIDEYGRLVGVCSLRQLVVFSSEKLLKDFMTIDVLSVQTDMDQEEVAKIVARYDILAVPVTDENNKLVGIITVDDIIDIIREEATEDILKMAGAGEEFGETKSVFLSTRNRLPWLFASCLGGILAFFIISNFEKTLSKLTFLAAFIPVIMGMGGNVGTQSSTIVVRGIATGKIIIKDIIPVVWKEVLIGSILGICYGLFIGIVAASSYSKWQLGIVVGSSVLSSMIIATFIGSLVPMLFARINIDPAVATGPFVTTAIDILSVYFYFMIAIFFFNI